jgi:hypothetical protein
MLRITIPPTQSEDWDEKNETFLYRPIQKEQTLTLEHSLISISKWESKWHKSFLHSEKTEEEIMDYIKFMTLTPNVDPEIYNRLTSENIEQIKNYIMDPMTATTFSDVKTGKPNREIVTSELIYYWMITLHIPVEFEKWHINRLLTLIRVCEIKNTPPKKRSAREIMNRNAALNEARRKKLNTKG